MRWQRNDDVASWQVASWLEIGWKMCVALFVCHSDNDAIKRDILIPL